MNKEKQIEEIKLIIDKAEEEYSEIWNEWFYDHKEGTKIDNEFLFFAKMLYDAGYRKASEIFEEIDRLLEIDEKDFDKVFEESRSEDDDNVSLALSNYVYGIRQMFAELKKKFTEDGK